MSLTSQVCAYSLIDQRGRFFFPTFKHIVLSHPIVFPAPLLFESRIKQNNVFILIIGTTVILDRFNIHIFQTESDRLVQQQNEQSQTQQTRPCHR